MRSLLDQLLPGVWLHFTNGAFQRGQLVHTTRDAVPDTALSAALAPGTSPA